MALMAKENIRTIQEQTNGARFQSQTVVFLWKNALPNLLVFVTQFYKQAEWNEKNSGEYNIYRLRRCNLEQAYQF